MTTSDLLIRINAEALTTNNPYLRTTLLGIAGMVQLGHYEVALANLRYFGYVIPPEITGQTIIDEDLKDRWRDRLAAPVEA